MPIAATAEQRAIAGSVAVWARRSGSVAAVRGIEAGEPLAPGHWAGLAGLGVFSIAVPQERGGAGGTVADLAAVTEQLAAELVPGPVLPTLLVGLLLAGARPGGPPGELLAAIAAGDTRAGAAFFADGLIVTGTAGQGKDSALRVTGTASLVLGAGDAPYLLLGARAGGDGASAGTGGARVGEDRAPAGAGPGAGPREEWFVLPADQPGVRVTPRSPVDFSRSLADVTLDGVTVAAGQRLAGLRPGLVADLAAVLAAAEASGVATRCAEVAADHARTRRQFGRPIGSFQAVKHLCAQMHCRAELAAAAAAGAATAAGQAPGELPLATACAAALALDAAVDNAKDCIQVLGGIGFTWEHDAHLYLRRALALRHLLGGTPRWRERAARLAIGGMRRNSPGRENETVPPAAVRGQARAVAQRVSSLPPGQQRAALAGAGYAAPGWPPPYGLAASPADQVVIDEELGKAGLARPDLAIGGWAIPAIAGHGTPAQLDRFAGPTLRGEITWCQLFSEPEAGSDLASLRTRAVRVKAGGEAGGGWRLTGQKVWTSLASEADWAICLARTDPDAPRHRGIGYFLVPMRSSGIEVRPLREITGRAMFNEVFLDDVFVPDECLVGAPGDGWRIARSTLATERTAMGRGAGLGEEAEALLTAAAGADPVLPDQVGARVAEGLALAVMDDRLAVAVAGGAEPGLFSAVRKLLGVAHRQAVAETALELCGAQGAAADGPAAGAVHGFLLSRCLSIAGGTSQILLSLVAERLLGLPRDEAR